jgi:hypothetical protein
MGSNDLEQKNFSCKYSLDKLRYIPPSFAVIRNAWFQLEYNNAYSISEEDVVGNEKLTF